MNPTTKEKAEAFAKANKISKVKLLAFLESLPAYSAKPNAGRKAKPETQGTRQAIAQWLENQKGKDQAFTIKQMATACGALPVDATNALKWLQKEKGYSLAIVGKQEKQGKGKKANIFVVC